MYVVYLSVEKKEECKNYYFIVVCGVPHKKYFVYKAGAIHRTLLYCFSKRGNFYFVLAGLIFHILKNPHLC